jgi:hypothetical protein
MRAIACILKEFRTPCLSELATKPPTPAQTRAIESIATPKNEGPQKKLIAI